MKYNKTFIIAEIGNNHEGDIKLAKKLVKLAAKAGVDAVKFQTFKTEEFINKDEKKRFKQLKKFELSFDDFNILKELAHKYNLKFISTPLDLDSAKFIGKIADLIKIASGDNNFLTLIEHLLKFNKKLIISTGLMNFKDLEKLSKFIVKKIGKKKALDKISYLHCVTSYPVEEKYASLNSIPYLIKKQKFKIGYSDHTIGNEACLAAVSLGACIIEKHFTINKNFSKFRDHSLSADFEDLKSLVLSIRKIEKMKGNFEKIIQHNEKNILKLVRRSVFSKKKIIKGEIINLDKVRFLRPSNSNDYLSLTSILGKKSKLNIKKNQRLKKEKLY